MGEQTVTLLPENTPIGKLTWAVWIKTNFVFFRVKIITFVSMLAESPVEMDTFFSDLFFVDHLLCFS